MLFTLKLYFDYMKFIELFEDMINENVYSTTFLIPFPFSVFPLYFTHFYLFIYFRNMI